MSSTEDRPGQDTTPVDDADALVNRVFPAAQAHLARAAQDELAPRRALAQLRDRHAQLSPDEAARMDTEMTAATASGGG